MSEPLLEITDLTTYFPIRAGLFRSVVGQVHAVDGVSLTVGEKETVGHRGRVRLRQNHVRAFDHAPHRADKRQREVPRRRESLTASKDRMRELRSELQIVFQDPYASLNPRMPVNDIIAEPLRIHGSSSKEASDRVADLLAAVGLLPEHANRYPHEFSGGQRQRIGIARALALNPSLIVLDEPVSALDVSVQAQVINLLEDIQNEFNLAYMFIAHDLSVVRHISDRVMVMYLGKVAEVASSELLYESPAHPYSHSLLSAVPIADPEIERTRERIVLQGDIPSPANPPSGCRFRTRCPIAVDRCAAEEPPLREIRPGHFVSCHFPMDIGETLLDRVGSSHSVAV